MAPGTGLGRHGAWSRGQPGGVQQGETTPGGQVPAWATGPVGSGWPGGWRGRLRFARRVRCVPCSLSSPYLQLQPHPPLRPAHCPRLHPLALNLPLQHLRRVEQPTSRWSPASRSLGRTRGHESWQSTRRKATAAACGTSVGGRRGPAPCPFLFNGKRRSRSVATVVSTWKARGREVQDVPARDPGPLPLGPRPAGPSLGADSVPDDRPPANGRGHRSDPRATP